MDSTFITILQKLIAEQGKTALLNPAKSKSFLADYTKNERRLASKFLWGISIRKVAADSHI